MKAVRCAIYTRKSSEEGLEQGFNSLHAQREACEAYVLSQIGEGWRALPKPYDDGGFSGGSMDRPGLKALLADIAARRIDVVVVYKVDRLTRSLIDFAKIVELFDRHAVSFVSVTQAFNTTTSMGRLTLNVLLSFAQFEREVTGERIRDKLAASKKKGMWMGGLPPLGYDKPTDLTTRALVVNEAEAETVRMIFRTYLELGSVHALQRKLARDVVKSKAWVTNRGREMGGRDFYRGALFYLLSNRAYIGEIVHKDTSYPGAHLPIVDPPLFQAVQTKLSTRPRRPAKPSGRRATMALTGLIFDYEGEPMSPSFTRKRDRTYRYYTSAPLMQGRLCRPNGDGVLRRVSAPLVEAMISACLEKAAGRPIDGIRDFLQRVDVRPNTLRLHVTRSGIFSREPDPQRELHILRTRLAEITGAEVALAARPNKSRNNPDDAFRDFSEGEAVDAEPGFLIDLPCRLKRSGGRTWIVDGGGKAIRRANNPDRTLIKALRAAHHLVADGKTPIGFPENAALEAAPESRYDRRVSYLAFLSPEIQQLILEACQPAGLTLAVVMDAKIPLLWSDQRALFLP